MNNLKNFFWFCSGANQNLLKRCPTESSKYVGIGATVFFTGLLAAISSGYALYTVFESFWGSFFFGLVWGGMIFNLDRFIVCSMKKRGIFWQEFKVAVPRLILAILLALVISKPLELKIFEKEINRKIDSKKSEETIKAKTAINNGFPEITELEKKIAVLKNEIISKETYRNQKQQEYDFERFGKKTSGTTGIPGIGTNALKKEIQLNEAETDLKQTVNRNQPKIDQYEIDIKKLYSLRDNEFSNQKPNIDKYDGLAARIDALSVLSAESNAMNLANIFLILLFIAIETSPIFVKLISAKGPYDDLLEKHEHSIENFKIEQMSKLNQKTNERLEIVIQSGNNAVREELEGNRNLMKRIIEAETELAQELINQWKEDEMGKIKTGRHKKDNKA
ncbi:MAG: DUF4407 domain-containing protein [Chitinophagales bacterium]|nr:DUF4407 domain-containing protein [Chitinophagales bacterium]